MRESRLFKIVCDCCGAEIEIDPKTKSIFSIEQKGMKKRSFEEVVDDVTSVGSKAEKKFEKNLTEERNRKAHLEKIFNEATEKAKGQPVERPPNIFDFD